MRLRNGWSDFWLGFRVSFGDWVIQLGHRIAGDPRCSMPGCKNRRCPDFHDYCNACQSFVNAGTLPYWRRAALAAENEKAAQ